MSLLVTATAAWSGGPGLLGPVGVLVRGESITWVGPPERAPAHAQRLALDGVLLPGLVDHHVHTALFDPVPLLRCGLTTVVDLGCPAGQARTVAETSQRGDAPGPRVQAAGPFLTAPGGYPVGRDWAPEGMAWELAGPADAVEAVETLARHRPATVKVALNADADAVLDEETLRAVVRAAHAARLPVTAHAEGVGQTRRALEAGVDRFAHTPFTERLDDEILGRMAATVTVVSTVDIHGWGRWTPERETAVGNLARLVGRSASIVYGTDLGNGPLPEGINSREIDGLLRAGMTPQEVLASVAPGRLRPRARADLVAVPADPLADPDLLTRASPVLKAGVPAG